MTVSGKAKELVDKYYNLPHVMDYYDAKECALIAVDEILSEIKRLFSGYEDMATYKFWQQVKIEIKKL